jgi:hypothetical protein
MNYINVLIFQICCYVVCDFYHMISNYETDWPETRPFFLNSTVFFWVKYISSTHHAKLGNGPLLSPGIRLYIHLPTDSYLDSTNFPTSRLYPFCMGSSKRQRVPFCYSVAQAQHKKSNATKGNGSPYHVDDFGLLLPWSIPNTYHSIHLEVRFLSFLGK